MATFRLAIPYAERLRREIRDLESEKAKRLRVLAMMNAIECVEPGCKEPADQRSKRCTKHRLEHKRQVDRERQHRCRAKKAAH